MTQAGYAVSLQLVPYIFFEDQSDPVLSRLSPTRTDYLPYEPDGFATMTYSASGDVTAIAEGVDLILPAAAEPNTSTSGCDPVDFDEFTAGNIAIVQRGACSFLQKAVNAENAGAVGIVIFNEGQDGRTDAFGGTLGQAGIGIPAVSAAFDVGVELAAGDVQVRLAVDAITEDRLSANVLAEAPVGNPEQVVVVGAHLDSVPEGPGIQDNGTGSGAILEIALQLSELGMLDGGENSLANRLRFAWWGAEEAGLVGSSYYVANLPERDLNDIVATLNFDMIGSPNYVRFVYDGDGSVSEAAGPEGSAFIEWLFNDYFLERGLMTEPTAFDGRSDYGPFIDVGIPAGGLFTGAEGIKTEEQAGIYGGTAGEAYDPCYHEACDTFDNISLQGLDEMSDAAAHAVMVLGTNDLPEPAVALRRKNTSSSSAMDYRGNDLIK